MKLTKGHLYFIGLFVAYAFWGLLTTSSLFLLCSYYHFNQFLFILCGVLSAGLLPALAHLFEVRFRGEYFSWGVIFASLTIGGIMVLFLGCILQALLLKFGAHTILGLPIDNGSWKFPELFSNGY